MLLFNVSNKKIFHTRQQNYEIKSKPQNKNHIFFETIQLPEVLLVKTKTKITPIQHVSAFSPYKE